MYIGVSLAFFGNIFDVSSKAQTASEKTPRHRGNKTAFTRSQTADEKFDRLIVQAEEKGAARVIVQLNINFQPEGELNRSEANEQRAAVARAQTELLARLNRFRVSGVKQFEFIPFVALETDADAIRYLKAASEVKSIEEDEVVQVSMEESLPIIGAPAAWTAGATGRAEPWLFSIRALIKIIRSWAEASFPKPVFQQPAQRAIRRAFVRAAHRNQPRRIPVCTAT